MLLGEGGEGRSASDLGDVRGVEKTLEGYTCNEGNGSKEMEEIGILGGGNATDRGVGIQ